jgi:heme exporter protein A
MDINSVAVQQLACARGEQVLFQGLDFSLGSGELMQIAGENGSGKTSLLRIIAGLSIPAEGTVTWNGVSIRSLGEEYLTKMLYIGHVDGIKGDLSAEENLRMAAAFADEQLPRDALRAALRRFGLQGRERLPAKVLSQGQRRRLALCRMLIGHRPLWVLDEPYTALDVRGIEAVDTALQQHLESGGCVLMTSHQPIEVPGAVCRRIDLS